MFADEKQLELGNIVRLEKKLFIKAIQFIHCKYKYKYLYKTQIKYTKIYLKNLRFFKGLRVTDTGKGVGMRPN
jgi:hypothetical protein